MEAPSSQLGGRKANSILIPLQVLKKTVSELVPSFLVLHRKGGVK